MGSVPSFKVDLHDCDFRVLKVEAIAFSKLLIPTTRTTWQQHTSVKGTQNPSAKLLAWLYLVHWHLISVGPQETSLPPGMKPGLPTGQEAGWVSQLVWTWWQRAKSPSTLEIKLHVLVTKPMCSIVTIPTELGQLHNYSNMKIPHCLIYYVWY
jgi:hypothetical protein